MGSLGRMITVFIQTDVTVYIFLSQQFKEAYTGFWWLFFHSAVQYLWRTFRTADLGAIIIRITSMRDIRHK